MPYEINAKCPCCFKTANGLNEIERLFGFRNMPSGEKIPQSYCKECRSAHCEARKPCKAQ